MEYRIDKFWKQRKESGKPKTEGQKVKQNYSLNTIAAMVKAYLLINASHIKSYILFIWY
jgi:hypothetical protein